MPAPKLTIHTDGASRGNPGPAAFGYVIEKEGFAPIEEGDVLGEMSNNQAEYTALIRGLQHALQLGAEHEVQVFSDSELMVKQINGVYRVKKAELRELCSRAKELMKQLAKVQVLHVRREENKRADELCNEALDGQRKFSGAGLTEQEQAAEDQLREAALAYLHSAAETWGEGKKSALTPEVVWAELRQLVTKYLSI